MKVIHSNQQLQEAIPQSKIETKDPDLELTESADGGSNQSNIHDTYGVTEEQLEAPNFWINL
jgi:hypothetical protein